MSAEIVAAALLTAMTAATPLLLAALGELVVEKSGVLNLGVEGMMLVGAVAGFAVTLTTGDWRLGVLAAAAAGAALALVFAVLTLNLMSNQVATGLALTIFGIGLSSLIGSGFVGRPVTPVPKLEIPGLTDIPLIGPILFGQDPLVYFSFLATAGVAWFLTRSRGGMILRAVGESDVSAHALGYDVIRIRLYAVLFGGVMAGIAGGYLSLAYTPLWIEEMTAGRGWIALAIVVFAAWKPWRALAGAYLFGGVTILQLYLQGAGVMPVPSQIFSMLPYFATIVALVFISAGPWRARLNAPACLGKPFRPAA